jgi:hypothetical protein
MDGNHSKIKSGNATITNTSSAMRNLTTKSPPTSGTILQTGRRMSILGRDRKKLFLQIVDGLPQLCKLSQTKGKE